MDYSNQSVVALIRGPLLRTPQGWVVVASAVLYGLLAFAIGALGLTPPLGKSTSSAVVICLFWPLLVFLMFIKHGLPAFAPSWRQALFLAVAALSPLGYVAWHSQLFGAFM